MVKMLMRPLGSRTAATLPGVHGVPKLADIGLVARIDATMSFVGTEGCIPPEGPGTPQADLYSLGKVLYEISSGKDRTAFPEPLTLLGEAPEKARLLELNAVIHKACHKDPQQRYRSAAAMQVDLKLLERGRIGPPPASRPTPLGHRLATHPGLACGRDPGLGRTLPLPDLPRPARDGPGLGGPPGGCPAQSIGVRSTVLLSATANGLAGDAMSTSPVLAPDGRTVVFQSYASDLTAGDFNRDQDVFLLRLPGPESAFRIFSLTRLGTGETTLLWAAQTGRSYTLQFKEELAAPAWTDLRTATTVNGGQGSATDSTTAGARARFYRVMEHP
jgi:hypothetical protein